MWQLFKKPIIGLSPMDGVTDQPFRYITKKYGNPDLIYTEFTSVEGVCHGATALLKDFLFDQTQRPIIAQIFGTTPDYFRQTAIILCQLGFDGIDINIGCPAKTVQQSGAGAALIKTPKLAQEIIKATIQGVEEYQNGSRAKDCSDIRNNVTTEVEKRAKELPEKYRQPREIPVSVKTRVGYDQPIIDTWIPNILEMKPAAIALHGRTLKQGYSGEASWELIAQAAQLIKKTDTLILGNGDIESHAQAIEYSQKYNLDGVLIGRASFGNPFIFHPENHNNPSIYQVALEHAQIYEQTYMNAEKYSFLPMRKHLGWYIKGLANAKEIRMKLVRTNNSQEVENIFKQYGLIE